MATALYGNEEAIGKSVSIFNDANEEYTYTVAAVFEDLQQNSSFMIDILTHIDNFLTMWNVDQTDWKRLLSFNPEPGWGKADPWPRCCWGFSFQFRFSQSFLELFFP